MGKILKFKDFDLARQRHNFWQNKPYVYKIRSRKSGVPKNPYILYSPILSMPLFIDRKTI
jgi:hypothetical protein